MEQVIIDLVAKYWLIVLVSFVLGMLTGWGLAKPSEDDDEDVDVDTVQGEARTEPVMNGDLDTEPPDYALFDEVQLTEKVKTLEAELANAHQLLADFGDKDSDVEETFTAIEDALKRANGRLKVVINSFKKSKGSD